ncbi:MAG: hypothetical protein HQ463_00410, partial [Bacteroidetes bacterium]|nr:hypothetical protein [Bacteroidota bacterium]
MTEIILPINYLYDIPISRITSLPALGTLYYDAINLSQIDNNTDLSSNTIWY